MLDIKFIRDNAAAVRKGAADKRITCDIDRLIELDVACRVNDMRHFRGKSVPGVLVESQARTRDIAGQRAQA